MDLPQLKTMKSLQLTIPGLYGIDLHPYQKVGVAAIQSVERLILGDDVGLGKTVQSVAGVQLLHSMGVLDRRDVLVICPKGVRPDWFSTFKDHTPLTPLIGDESDQKCKFLDRQFNVLIIGHPTARIRVDLLSQRPWKMIIVDEGMFKNSNSKTFAAIRKMTDKAQRTLILNATSFEVSMGEVYSHIELTSPGLISYDRFKEQYCKVEQTRVRTKYRTTIIKEKISGPKTLNSIPELKELMNKFYIKRTAEEVSVQLPKKVRKNIRVELLPCQKAEYVEQIEQFRKKMFGPAQLLYNLLRISDGKLKNWALEPNPEKVSAKGQALQNLVQSLGNQQFIVYSTYLDPLLASAKIVKAMGKRIGFYSGENQGSRDKHLAEFKAGQRDCMFLTQAAQRGLNIQNCQHMIMMNQLYNAMARDQLEGRIRRVTSAFENVFIYNILTVDTVEQNLIEMLSQREVLSNIINDEGSGISGLTPEQLELILKPRKSLVNKKSLKNSFEIFGGKLDDESEF
jgi:SNF2 family DNA or RNA helicase